MTQSDYTETLDAVVMGAGVAGLYQLLQLRREGLKVRLFEKGSDLGGTWFWNRYPGARFDSEAYIYQYLFDEDLYKDWSWSERFPGQPEIEKWLHYVADRLNLRKDIKFNAEVKSAVYDEDRKRWTVKTSAGDVIDCQFFISCAGMLSAPIGDQWPGRENFKGTVVYTSSYPAEGPPIKGKRVGVVGIGATGIQVIQTIAKDVGHLTVFARTPQYVVNMRNPKFTEEDVAEYKDRYEELQKLLPHTFTGFEYVHTKTWAGCTPEERIAHLEDVWADGSLKMWVGSFPEVFTDAEINEEVSEFIRGKMRERLNNDPKLCEILIPKKEDYGFGTHRVPLESKYLEVYLQPNVEPVSVRNNPIVRFTEKGLQLKDGTEVELDTLILATGFDAGSGSLSRIDVRGREGVSLADEWHKDIRTTYGLGKHGFPNLFTTAVPLAPAAALCNMPTCLQQQTEWITRAILDMKKDGVTTMEATAEGEDAWVKHHDAVANMTLVPTTDSWYMGSNIPGKPRRLLSYIGGVGPYRQKCDEEATKGYPSFVRV